MAFEEYNINTGRLGMALKPLVSITKNNCLYINSFIVKSLVDECRYGTVYFDTDTNRVAVHFSEQSISDGSRKVSKQKGCSNCEIAMGSFLRFYNIVRPQPRIPATIESVNGKDMIVFPVKIVEEGD